MTKKKNNKSAIRTEKDKKVPRLNRTIYSATDATYGYPKGDMYDFNGFEPFVPKEPFDIKDFIPLRKYGLGGPAPSELFKGVKLAPVKQVGGAASTLRNIGRNFTSSLQGIGSAMGGAAIGALGQMAGKGASNLIGGGLSSGAGNAITGVTGTIGGALSNVNPLLGGAVSLIGGAVGGAVNRVFGSKLNNEKIASVEGDINRALSFTSNAEDFDSLTTNFENLQGIQGFSQSDIGKDGWASNKARNKFRKLSRQAEEAEAWQQAALEENAANIINTNQQLLEANYTAYGGPIDMKYTGVMSPFGNQFRDGGIFIKPSKRGTFTAAAKKRGMGVQEFASKVLANKEDYSPAMVKKANFAKNASKWHDDGGLLDLIRDSVRDTWDSRKTFFNFFRGLPLMLEYEKPSYGGGNFGGGGASSVPIESPDTYSLVKDTLWIPYRETFNDAFGRARAAGLDEFVFDNKAYTTELGDNPNNNRAGEERVIEGLLPIERTRQVKNKKAEGGNLFTNGVTIIGNGDTHENNPLEGVPMGIDSQGIPNLVEEGEVIFNDYVFSNRLRVPEAIRQKYKLRGVTFADAAKQVQKESEERPNDPIAKDTMNAIMSELTQEQEMIRAKRNKNKYANGGRLVNKFALGDDIDIIDNPYSVYTSNPIDNFNYGNWFTVDKNNLGRVTSYSDPYKNFYFTADQARAYAANNPNDESLKSYLARGNKLEDLTDEDVQKGSLDYMHGWLHKARARAAASERVTNPSFAPTRSDILANIDSILSKTSATPINRNIKAKVSPIQLEQEIIDELPLPTEASADGGIAPMRNHWLRYAPIAGAGLAVLNDWFGGNKPDYSNADLYADAIKGANRQIGYRPIGNYLRYTPFDRDFYINKLNANTGAGRRAVTNTSGGNRAAALAGILATDYNYGNQLGDLARKAEEYNLAQRQQVEDFNRATNMFNSEMGTKVDMFNAENTAKQASLYGNLAAMRQGIADRNRAERAANLTNFIQGLGDLGKEMTDRDKLRWLADLGVLAYNPRGKYTKGEKKSNKSSKGDKKKRGGFTI